MAEWLEQWPLTAKSVGSTGPMMAEWLRIEIQWGLHAQEATDNAKILSVVQNSYVDLMEELGLPARQDPQTERNIKKKSLRAALPKEEDKAV
uniref:Uncharacterized protein n=1 Tax=Magallana gigas TaxID=29159 RepID=K1PZT5_MAGGI